MIKVKKGDIVYYYQEHLAETLLNALVNDLISRNSLYLTQMADIVINTKTNQFIKCRYTLEDMIDKMVK